MGIFLVFWSIFISKVPIHSAGHSFGSAKSQLFFGTRNPARAARDTTVRPSRPPSKDGNSGPRKRPARAYGTVKANAEKSANGTIGKASAHDLLRPKNRVMNITKNTGISVPQMAWPKETRSTIRLKKAVQSCPCACSAAVIASR